jgi:hypothetical protein
MDRSNPLRLLILVSTILKPQANDDIILEDEVTVYKQIVSCTIYLANNTRLDISYNVRQLARFIANPGAIYLIFAKQLLRYLSGTCTIGIVYSGPILDRRYSIYSDFI